LSSEIKRTPEKIAKDAFEMLSAFGENAKVVNILTGKETLHMSDNIEQINKKEMVSVPVAALQSLIWNCEIAVAGMGRGEVMVADTCRELQRYISDAAGVPMPSDGFSFDEFENIEFVDFRKRE
jgi:hypothetical protein